MTNYKDLTGDDVLQAGDVFHYLGEERNILTIWIGDKAKKHPHKFRRPLTTREIVAAERVKFEELAAKEPLIPPIDRFKVGDKLPEERVVGEYIDVLTQLCWEFYCAALSIDPMGDVE